MSNTRLTWKAWLTAASLLLASLAIQADQTSGMLAGSQSGEVFVVGLVQRPGVYPFSNGITVQGAIDAAGGLTTTTPILRVTRVIAKRRQQTSATMSTPLQVGDEIFVGETRR